ncbi:hybrid sensor histidine kinase/response regulator [Desulfonatronum thioautotrophicum]|uniref:hybrid sensor histidine kinase/response regulator n=1 Tax=Desulfonatronum thioautotrophicum TaxID=617001 RepID=UPI00069BC02D|nr:hybrid sensor histidine kinase/response regulator [Desulfonatronum thioautotrophicum]
MQTNDLERNSMDVLVVDDEHLSRKTLGLFVRKLGHRLLSAENGLQALKVWAEHAPRVVLTDWSMPEMDGAELCRRIRDREGGTYTYVIMVTARTDANDLVAGFEAGVDDYLTKPVRKEELYVRLKAAHRLLASREALRELSETLEKKVEERGQELAKAQHQLILAEKMSAIGQLAAGIAHELNNPINFVSLNFQVLEEHLPLILEVLTAHRRAALAPPGSDEQLDLLDRARRLDDESSLDLISSEVSSIFQQSRDGFQRVTAILNSVRDFSRTDSREAFVFSDLNKGIRDTLVVAKHAYKSHADIVLELGDIPHVECISGQINQVFLNLIVNASQALAETGRSGKGMIRIQTRRDGEHVICAITNNGPVIPEDVRDCLFNPFFTTKQPGRGTGLGLSISHDIVVRKHGGRLTFTSDENDGTTFRIVLPIRRGVESEVRHE